VIDIGGDHVGEVRIGRPARQYREHFVGACIGEAEAQKFGSFEPHSITVRQVGHAHAGRRDGSAGRMADAVPA
jgi:hypothetical protein